MSIISMTLAPTFQRELQSRPDREEITLVADRYLNRLEQYIRENPTLFLRPDATPDVVWSAVQSTPGDNIPPFQKFDIDRNTSFTIDGTDYIQSVPTALKTFSSNIRFDDTTGTPTATITSTMPNDDVNDRYGIVRFAWPYNNRFRIMVDSTLGNTTITSRRLVTIPPPPLPALGEAEFEVNTYTTSWQDTPSVTALSNGGFVVVWESNGQDGSGEGVYGQRYNSLGTTIGSEFQINTYTTDDQKNISVAALSDGGFVIVWESNGQDGSGYGVFGRRYNSSGVPVDSEFRVNTFTPNSQGKPSVAALSNGGFVVVWTSSGNGGGNLTDIYGQRYNSLGITIGSEFRLNTTTTNWQDNSSVVALSNNGEFVVVWTYFDPLGISSGVYGQRYDQFGVNIGSEFKMSPIAPTYSSLSVASLSDGGFVTQWTSYWSSDSPCIGSYTNSLK